MLAALLSPATGWAFDGEEERPRMLQYSTSALITNPGGYSLRHDVLMITGLLPTMLDAPILGDVAAGVYGNYYVFSYELGLTGGLDSPSMVRVWFGILFCVNMQVSFLSPPFGPAAFYLKSVAPPHITLPDIFRGFLPFMCMQIIILALILLVPEITTVFL